MKTNVLLESPLGGAPEYFLSGVGLSTVYPVGCFRTELQRGSDAVLRQERGDILKDAFCLHFIYKNSKIIISAHCKLLLQSCSCMM